jgi:hypothetical protein
MRIDCSQGSHGTLGLCALQARALSRLLGLLDRRQDSIYVLQTLPLARRTLQVVCWPAVHEPTKIGHEK